MVDKLYLIFTWQRLFSLSTRCSKQKLKCLNRNYLLSLRQPLQHLFEIIGLFIVMMNSAYSESASTINFIHGSRPYLTYDGGRTKIDSTEALLGIGLSNGTFINAAEDSSSIFNPIELPNINDTIANIQTIVPLSTAGNSNYPVINMSDLLRPPYNYFGDDDGDGYAIENGNVTATATGRIRLKWEIRDPSVSNLNSSNAFKDITSMIKNDPNISFSPCDGPYRLTISADNGELETLYGEPNRSSFTASSHTYYINPNRAQAKVCYIQPNLVSDNTSQTGYYTNGSLWDNPYFENGKYRGYPSKGYKVVNAHNSGNYNGSWSVTQNNFPTTGSHGLFFYLLLGGITPENVLYANGNLVSAVEGGNVHLSLSVSQTQQWHHTLSGMKPYGMIEPALKVTLIGPRFNSGDKSFRPLTFRLYADSSKSKLLYEFKLMRWYIVQPGVTYGSGYPTRWTKYQALSYQSEAKNYCSGLGNGYRLADVNDFTNNNYWDTSDYPWIDIIWGGGIPDRPTNSYLRQISYQDGGRWIGGINNEWGCLSNGYSNARCQGYPGSDWDNDSYWSASIGTYEYPYNGEPLVVNNIVGVISIYDRVQSRTNLRAACVIP